MEKEEYEFPIKYIDVTIFDTKRNHSKKRRRYTTEYLSDNFDFEEFFNNKYYRHLENDIASVTIKAVLGCAFATGLGTGELLKDYDKNKYLLLEDVKIENNQVTIKYEGSNIDEIILTGKVAEYIISYNNMRKNGEEKVQGAKRSSGKEGFFIKLWEGKNLNIDWNIWDRKSKPPTIYELVRYMLMFICSELKIKCIGLNDIRSNMVYHNLVNSRGSALNEIVKLHGYLPFVEEAYQRYIKKSDDKDWVGFDFFNSTSLSENIVSKEDDNEVATETYMSRMERKKRNQKIVRELKDLYKNKCQVCGESIKLGNKIKYSEVHHIQPLGSEHNGVDNKSNMIVLCPNHHKMFDLGILAIDPVEGKKLIHVDKGNSLNNKKIVFYHAISNVCIRYAYEYIHLTLKKELIK